MNIKNSCANEIPTSLNNLLEYMECILRNIKKSTPTHNIVLGIYKQLKKIIEEWGEQNDNK